MDWILRVCVISNRNPSSTSSWGYCFLATISRLGGSIESKVKLRSRRGENVSYLVNITWKKLPYDRIPSISQIQILLHWKDLFVRTLHFHNPMTWKILNYGHQEYTEYNDNLKNNIVYPTKSRWFPYLASAFSFAQKAFCCFEFSELPSALN